MIQPEQIAIAGQAIPTTRNDKLRVVIYEMQANANAFIRVLQVLPDGTQQTTVEQLALTGSGGQKVKTINLTDGYLISISIYTANETDPLGRIFVNTFFQRGDSFGFSSAFPLCSGYIGAQKSIVWPQDIPLGFSDIVPEADDITIVAPGAGGDIEWTASDFEAVKILGGQFFLTTSAAGVARQVNAVFSANGLQYAQVFARTTQAPSTTRTYTLWPGPNIPDDTTTIYYLPVPDIPISGFVGLSMFATIMDVADAWATTAIIVQRHIQAF